MYRILDMHGTGGKAEIGTCETAYGAMEAGRVAVLVATDTAVHWRLIAPNEAMWVEPADPIREANDGGRR